MPRSNESSDSSCIQSGNLPVQFEGHPLTFFKLFLLFVLFAFVFPLIFLILSPEVATSESGRPSLSFFLSTK